MQQLLDQFTYLLKDFWRFRWAGLVVAWLIALIGWVAIFFVPNVYESSAKVYADTDSILRPLLKGIAVDTNIENRLTLMTQTLLSQPNLERVMRETDMDLEIQSDEDKERLLARLAEDIHVKTGRGTDLYTIGYENKHPEQAEKVVQALLDIFLETTLGEKREDDIGARQFIDKEIADYEKRLNSAEHNLMVFKQNNIGALPSQEKDYFGRLSSLKNEEQNARFELRQAEQRVSALKSQLAEFKKNATSSSASTMITTSVDTRLNELRNSLNEMLLKYTDEHPSVIEMRASIEELEAKRQKELENIRDSGRDSAALTDNPLYQELSLAIGEASANAAEARVRVSEYQRRLAQTEDLIETLPQTEAQLAALNRDYEVIKEQYHALLERRESAQLSGRADASGDKLKLQVIEAPRIPLTPSGPNRFLMATMVLIAALGCGIAVTYFLGQVKPVIYDIKSLRDFTGFPVFGMVSKVVPDHFRFKEIMYPALSFAGAGSMLIALYAGVLVVQLNYFERVQSLIERVEILL